MTREVMAAFLAIFALLLAIFYLLLRRGKHLSTDMKAAPARTEVLSAQRSIPTGIVIGDDPFHPAVTIEMLNSPLRFEKAERMDFQNASTSRLGSLLQAVPSLLIAGKAAGDCLMEVVINGSLTQAANGDGWRAFSIGKGGITEHATLREATTLQQMINAAAIWQVASVIVAQKHLADISSKLVTISENIQAIAQFLDNQRKSRILSTHDYLGQVYRAIQAGELPNSARSQLETCERDMIEIQRHLEMEYEQIARTKAKDEAWYGTKSLAANLGKKLDALDNLTQQIALCLRTRIAAWQILSLFPGELQLKSSRREAVSNSLENFEAMGHLMRQVMEEIQGIDSKIESKKTLVERKRGPFSKYIIVEMMHTSLAKQCAEELEPWAQLLANDQPTRILLRVKNGCVVEARQS